MTFVLEEPLFRTPSPTINPNLKFLNNVKRQSQIFKSIADLTVFILLSFFYTIKSIYKYLLPMNYRPVKDLKGEIGLVTGGGSGLGQNLVLKLAKLGVTVVVLDVNVKGIEETISMVRKSNGIAYGYKCDVSNNEDVYKVAAQVRKEIGDVTLLINNAGVATGTLLLDTPDYLIKRTFDVNIIAHFWTVKAFLPQMIQKGHGHIVTIASMAGHVGTPKLIDYCASKHAAVGFDEALRIELESQNVKGVKTTAICPYFISTGLFDTVHSRFLPLLTTEIVVDRIIDAIKHNEIMVMIPKLFYFGMMLKSIFPWQVSSLFLRGLVQDLSVLLPSSSYLRTPSSSINRNEPEEKLQKIIDKNNIHRRSSLSDTSMIMSETHRYSPIGKNL